MSSESEEREHLTNHADEERSQADLPPLTPASDVDPANYVRARFDDGLAFAIKEEARRRAPNKWSEWRHRVGFAGELATSGYFRVPVNRDIYSGYRGDGGYDLKVPIHGTTWRIQVKTISHSDPELRVHEDRIDDSDYFVLCRTSDPTKLVKIIGWTTSRYLDSLGQRSPNNSQICMPLRLLNPLEPVWIPPDRIRDAQESAINSG